MSFKQRWVGDRNGLLFVKSISTASLIAISIHPTEAD
jgi:hypothetical protein